MAGCSVTSKYEVTAGARDVQTLNIEGCEVWLSKLDLSVKRNRAGDSRYRQVDDYPSLRVNRFLASFELGELETHNRMRDWIESMALLNEKGRDIEISNLASNEIAKLGGDRYWVKERANTCSRLLTNSLLEGPMLDIQHLKKRTRVDAEYSVAKRFFGLYSILKFPFMRGVEQWQKSVKQLFDNDLEEVNPDVKIIKYQPAVRDEAAEFAINNVMSKRDALGQLALSSDQELEMFEKYAPVFRAKQTGPFDRIGEIVWSDSGEVMVDTTAPTVYIDLTYTRFHGQILPQLIYVAWVSERPKERIFDLLEGRLDGIIWRVTLDIDGLPLIYDTIHPCGCYHMFFPTSRLQAIPSTRKDVEWAFSPKGVLPSQESKRIEVTLESKTHYFSRLKVESQDNFDLVENYNLKPYKDLSILAGVDGIRSIFRPDGLIEGTERLERIFFWPMGIRSAGAMRKLGSHATAFVGRRHFDDPDLLERRFRRR